jgi:hypothetical protein
MLMLLPNAQRSHAGPVTAECSRDAVRALAAAVGWTSASLIYGKDCGAMRFCGLREKKTHFFEIRP